MHTESWHPFGYSLLSKNSRVPYIGQTPLFSWRSPGQSWPRRSYASLPHGRYLHKVRGLVWPLMLAIMQAAGDPQQVKDCCQEPARQHAPMHANEPELQMGKKHFRLGRVPPYQAELSFTKRRVFNSFRKELCILHKLASGSHGSRCPMSCEHVCWPAKASCGMARPCQSRPI